MICLPVPRFSERLSFCACFLVPRHVATFCQTLPGCDTVVKKSNPNDPLSSSFTKSFPNGRFPAHRRLLQKPTPLRCMCFCTGTERRAGPQPSSV